MVIEVHVPDGESGDWKVDTTSLSDNDITFQKMRAFAQHGRGCFEKGPFKRLIRNNETIMSNTPDECRDFMWFVDYATGTVLLNGLGLGVVVQALLNKKDVTEIIVIEKSEDVIKLCGPTYLKDPSVTLIHEDAFEYQPPKGKRYNAVWHDIWDSICIDNIEDMKKLHRKYGRRCDYQKSWARERCESERREEQRENYNPWGF